MPTKEKNRDAVFNISLACTVLIDTGLSIIVGSYTNEVVGLGSFFIGIPILFFLSVHLLLIVDDYWQSKETNK